MPPQTTEEQTPPPATPATDLQTPSAGPPTPQPGPAAPPPGGSKSQMTKWLIWGAVILVVLVVAWKLLKK